jgi:hypothetical protein
MKPARAPFTWKAVSGDSTAMRTGAELIGTGRTGSEGTGTEPIEIERTEIERTGIGGTWSEGTWAIGTSQLASAIIVEVLRASTANGTLKVTLAEFLNLSQCGNRRSRSVALGHELPRRRISITAAIPSKGDIREGGGAAVSCRQRTFSIRNLMN